MSQADTDRTHVPPADILMVNWNGAFFLRHLLPLALELTGTAHRFNVWDNASRDGSWGVLSALAREFPRRLRVFRSLTNRRHGTGLRALLPRTRRDLLVVMDCDAVPLREGWVEELARPVLAGAAAHGIPHTNQGGRYVHPSCLCTTRTTLRALDVDVRPRYPDVDVFQRLTNAASAARAPLSFLDADGDYLFDGFGRTYGGGLVYHHWFGTRLNPVQGKHVTPEDRTRAGLVASQKMLEEWLRARSAWRTTEATGGGLGTSVAGVWAAHAPARLVAS